MKRTAPPSSHVCHPEGSVGECSGPCSFGLQQLLFLSLFPPPPHFSLSLHPPYDLIVLMVPLTLSCRTLKQRRSAFCFDVPAGHRPSARSVTLPRREVPWCGSQPEPLRAGRVWERRWGDALCWGRGTAQLAPKKPTIQLQSHKKQAC